MKRAIKESIKSLPYLKAVFRERDRLRVELARTRERESLLAGDNKHLSARLRDSEAEREAVEAERARLVAEKNSLRAERDLLEAAEHSSRAENVSLQAENASLQAANSSLEDERRRLAAEVEELRREAVRNRTWITPGHFYSPITSAEEIRRKEPEIWKKPFPDREIAGVALNEAEQWALWGRFVGYYREQPWAAHRREGLRYFFENENFSYSDALFLYYMLRHLRPRRLVEVGSGYSSCVTLDTDELFLGGTLACTFVEPHTDLLFSLIKEEDKARIRVIPERVQDVGVELFSELEAGDVLFVDSTHVAKTASDVNHIFFNVLPRLRSGVFVHFHDIYYPFVYPREWEYEGRSWNETYVLRAFLQYNSAFRVYLFNSFLQYFHDAEFRRDMPLSMLRTGGSIWLEKL